MRHQRLRRKLGVKSSHRKALLRNLTRALVTHKRIRTTHAKAKEASAFVDRMVTIAKRGDLHARRLLISRISCDQTAKRLITEIAPLFKDLQGGYTRVLRIQPRSGDGSEMALLEFTRIIETAKPKKPKKEKKKAALVEKEKAAEAPAKEKEPKGKKKPKTEPAAEEKAKAPEKETEKKGGFLGALRKFLKGSE